MISRVFRKQNEIKKSEKFSEKFGEIKMALTFATPKQTKLKLSKLGRRKKAERSLKE